MNSFSIPPLISALVFLSIGVTTLLSSQSRAKLHFAMLCILTVIWQFSWTILFNVKSPLLADLIIKIGYSGIIFLPIVYVHFVMRFCGKPLGFLKMSYMAAFTIFTIHLLSDWFISGHYEYFWGYYPKAGILHPAYLLLVTASFLGSIGPMLKYWRSCKSAVQLNQFKYVAVSYVLYFFAAIDFVVNYGIEFYPPGFLFILSSIAIIAYAIARHEVLDINFVVKKTLLYSTLLALLIIPCLAIIYLSENFVPDAGHIYIHTALLIIVGFIFPRIKVRAERNLENMLFGGEVRYRAAFEKFSNKLVRLQKIDELMNDVVETIANAVDADALSIFLEDNRQDNFILKAKYGNSRFDTSSFGKNEIDLIEHTPEGGGFSIRVVGIDSKITTIPIVFEKTLLGFMAIELNSSSIADISVYNAMTNQLAVAINNSLQFEEIRKLNLNLEQKVSERTQALSAAYEDLKGLAALKDHFFSRVSHELRTPLTNIILPVQASLEDFGANLHPDNRAEKESILRNASKLLKQINEILDLSKSEAGKHTIRVAAYDITKILDDVVLSATLTAKQAGISINFSKSESYFLYIDADKIEKVLTNILSNALKFTPAGGTIDIVFEEFDEKLKLSFRDSGIGISQEDLPHIFKAFHQVESNFLSKNQGTGLGLAICKEFIELHHADISVESELERGTTFILEFKKGKDHFNETEIAKDNEWPNRERRFQERRISDVINNVHKSVWECREVDSDTTNSELVSLQFQSPTNQRKRILLVEDNRDLANNIVRKLSQTYLVETAKNGQEGLDKISEFGPDIVLSDVMMPVMDGFTMCHKIKSNKETQDIPVVLITAKQSTKDKVEGFDAGADYYLLKPFDFTELHAVLKSMLIKKEFQTKLKEKNMELQKIQIELEKAMADTRKASEAKSRFLASMSHELRTPLNAIIGYSEMLAEEVEELNLDKNISDDLEKISISGKHLLSLINNVLDLAKIESGKVDLYLEDFEIVRLIANVETLLAPLANKNNNAYIINIDKSAEKMRADETKVRQIILNLLSNAFKFTKHGTVTLDVTSLEIDAAPWIRFSVSDNGIGMTNEQLAILFNEYAQAEQSTTKNFGGTGLGLAISKYFCEMMGGNIQVDSELGKGATFSVVIPKEVKETTTQNTAAYKTARKSA